MRKSWKIFITMIKCEHCGVELERNMNFCPLCGHPVGKDPMPLHEPVKVTGSYGRSGSYKGIAQLNRSQKRKLIWEVASIVLLSGIGGVTLLNLIFSRSLTWALYPIVLGLSVFLYITVFSRWSAHPWRQVIGTFFITFFMLFFIDYVHQGLQWALTVAFPLLLGSWAAGIVLYTTARRIRYYGFNLIAYVFVALAMLMMLLEGVLSYYQYHAVHLEWSIIVMISVIPVIAVLLYIHFRLRKNPDLRKFFHI